MVKGDFKLSRLKIIEQCGVVKSGVEKSETEKIRLALGFLVGICVMLISNRQKKSSYFA